MLFYYQFFLYLRNDYKTIKIAQYPLKVLHCIWYYIASDDKASVLEILGIWSNPSLPLLSGQLWLWKFFVFDRNVYKKLLRHN